MFRRVKEILSGNVSGETKLRGWVYNSRSSGGIVFILLRDGTGLIQCTVKKDEVPEDVFKTAESLSQESSIIVHGEVNKDERAPGGYEIKAKKIEIVHKAEEYPIAPKEHGVEFLLDNRHLHIRSVKMQAIMRIKDAVMTAARDWFHKEGFVEVTPPIILKQACEGGSTLFKLDYFGHEAYLSQSAQLHLEAMIFGLEKVYSVTPSFRAEKSRTRRHLTEYWHIEAEAAWADFEENLRIQEELVSYICQRVADERAEDLKFLGQDPNYLKKMTTPFPRITYDEAIEMLKKDGFDVYWGMDFGTEEERQLSTHFDKPFFIMFFPKQIKAFYMKARDEKTVLGADLIAPQGFGEIIGGSERETDHRTLVERLKEEGEKIENYQWYLDLRKYGSVPHSGFGLGTERLVRWICKTEHIRDVIPFPRTPNRFYP
ncbi:MAG: asparagine--tRNA ligase [Candidatus Aenigmarchaeota archaeon]|nr:asparagine--tRNA ligase [Candidatus Aenigmarchaeota archaeon]